MICELLQKMPKNRGRTELKNTLMIVRGENSPRRKQDTRELYRFLQMTAGNYRNAIFVECDGGVGYMLTTDRDARPILFPMQRFYELTGELPQRDEMCGSLSRRAFENLYQGWLQWNTDGAECPICSMYEKQKI